MQLSSAVCRSSQRCQGLATRPCALSKRKGSLTYGDTHRYRIGLKCPLTKTLAHLTVMACRKNKKERSDCLSPGLSKAAYVIHGLSVEFANAMLRSPRRFVRPLEGRHWAGVAGLGVKSLALAITL